MALLAFPPLGLLLNVHVAALNELRHVAALSLLERVAGVAGGNLARAVQAVATWREAERPRWPAEELEAYQGFCRVRGKTEFDVLIDLLR